MCASYFVLRPIDKTEMRHGRRETVTSRPAQTPRPTVASAATPGVSCLLRHFLAHSIRRRLGQCGEGHCFFSFLPFCCGVVALDAPDACATNVIRFFLLLLLLWDLVCWRCAVYCFCYRFFFTDSWVPCYREPFFSSVLFYFGPIFVDRSR